MRSEKGTCTSKFPMKEKLPPSFLKTSSMLQTWGSPLSRSVVLLLLVTPPYFDQTLAEIFSTLPSPTVSERNRAVPSGSECFRVFPIVSDHISTKFRAVLSNSEGFRGFPIYFIKNFKVHFL